MLEEIESIEIAKEHVEDAIRTLEEWGHADLVGLLTDIKNYLEIDIEEIEQRKSKNEKIQQGEWEEEDREQNREYERSVL